MVSMGLEMMFTSVFSFREGSSSISEEIKVRVEFVKFGKLDCV